MRDCNMCPGPGFDPTEQTAPVYLGGVLGIDVNGVRQPIDAEGVVTLQVDAQAAADSAAEALRWAVQSAENARLSRAYAENSNTIMGRVMQSEADAEVSASDAEESATQAAGSATAAAASAAAAQTAAERDVPAAAAAWLSEHVDPETGYVLDDSLSIQGAAADAKASGDKVRALTGDIESLVQTSFDSIILTQDRWTWAAGINPTTGGNNTTRYAARTAFTQAVRPILITLDNPDYTFDVFLYTTGSYTGFIGRAKGDYNSENVMISPDRDYTYYRICVQRTDRADMTSGIDDPTSDEYKVLKQYLKVTTTTDDTLSQRYVPADSKSVGDAIDAIGAKIRVMQYNVGKFRWGYVYEGALDEWGLTEEQYTEKLKNYKELLAKYQPDVAGFQEWAYYMDKAQTHQTTAVLLDDVYRYVHPINASANVLIAGNANLTNGRFVTLHGTNEDSSTETFNWYLADLRIGSKTICVATGALSSTSLTARTGQITELCADYLSTYTYAIILSDLNSSLKYENGVLVDNTLGTVLAITDAYGFYACQRLNGYWGATESYVRHQGVTPDNIYRCLDNILVKGNVKIRNFEVLMDEYESLASDHVPLIADLYVY